MYHFANFRYDELHVWNLIVGVQYVTVASSGLAYSDVLEALAGEMGGEFKKPVVLLSLNSVRSRELSAMQGLELFDHEFGV